MPLQLSRHNLIFIFSSNQVECKKAQPKEVMLPATLARGRAAAAAVRGGYGELLSSSASPSNSSIVASAAALAAAASASNIRYAPYSVPCTAQAAAAAAAAAAAPPNAPAPVAVSSPQHFSPLAATFPLSSSLHLANPLQMFTQQPPGSPHLTAPAAAGGAVAASAQSPYLSASQQAELQQMLCLDLVNRQQQHVPHTAASSFNLGAFFAAQSTPTTAAGDKASAREGLMNSGVSSGLLMGHGASGGGGQILGGGGVSSAGTTSGGYATISAQPRAAIDHGATSNFAVPVGL